AGNCHEEQGAHRRHLGVHDARPLEGVHRRAADDARVLGRRDRRAEVYQGRHRHQGPPLRRGGSHGRALRAAEGGGRRVERGGAQPGPFYLPSEVKPPESKNDEQDDPALAALSDRVRTDELYAFVEIPANALDPASREPVRYFSNHPAYRPLPNWISGTINREVVNRRFRDAALDRALVSRLTKRLDMSELGLLQRDTTGAIKAAPPIDKVRTIAIPVGMMMILLFSVMSGAPQLLNSVIEEKMSR